MNNVEKINNLLVRITKNITSIICTILALFSLWVIFIVGLNLPILIPSFWDNETNIKLNNILLNLSYSYVAGCLFYIFTSYLPDYYERKKASSGIRLVMSSMDEKMRQVISCFGNGYSYSYPQILDNPDEIRRLMLSKDWNSIVPEFVLSKRNISYLNMVHLRNDEMEKLVNEFIVTYNRFLSSEQIVLCEKIRESSFLGYIGWLDSMPKVAFADDGLNYTIDLYIEIINLLQQLKKTTSYKTVANFNPKLSI